VKLFSYFSFCLVSLICLTTCASENSNFSSNLPSGGRLQLIDSINFVTSAETEFIIDYNSNSKQYLGLNSRLEYFVVWSNTGQKIAQSVISTSGPDKLRSIAKAGFSEEGGVVAMDRTRIMKFDTSGASISSAGLDISKSLPYPVGGFLIKYKGDEGVYTTAALNDQYSVDGFDFFNKSHGISCYKSNGEIVSNIAFFDKESPYRTSIFSSDFQPFFAVDNDLIYYVRPLDHKNVFFENCKKTKFGSIPIYLDHGAELFIPNGTDIEDQLQLSQLNSVLREVVVSDKYIVVQYREALNEDQFQSDIVAVNESPAKRREYISLYDKVSGEKICKDINIDEKLYRLLRIEGDVLFFVKRYNWDEEGTVIYKYKFNPVPL